MTRPRFARALPLAAALGFAAMSPVLAEPGTAEEREACTADALTFCQDTIPDVGKTTVCMQHHVSELSPKCRAVVSARTEPPPPGDEARVPPRDDDDQITGSLSPRHDDADDDDDDSGLRRSRATIAQLCADGLIDPGTCRRTERALEDAE